MGGQATLFVFAFTDGAGDEAALARLEFESDVDAVIHAVRVLQANPSWSAVRIMADGVEVASFTSDGL